MKACTGEFRPRDVWQPLNKSGNVGHYWPFELRNRCRGTSQYDPFFRAIRSLKTDGCGNGKGIKYYLSAGLQCMDTDRVFGKCEANPRFWEPSRGACPKSYRKPCRTQ